MENPINFLTEKQKEVVKKEIKEEGYCVLQRWKNRRGETDYRALKDTVVVFPHRLIDRIIWAIKGK